MTPRVSSVSTFTYHAIGADDIRVKGYNEPGKLKLRYLSIHVDYKDLPIPQPPLRRIHTYTIWAQPTVEFIHPKKHSLSFPKSWWITSMYSTQEHSLSLLRFHSNVLSLQVWPAIAILSAFLFLILYQADNHSRNWRTSTGLQVFKYVMELTKCRWISWEFMRLCTPDVKFDQHLALFKWHCSTLQIMCRSVRFRNRQTVWHYVVQSHSTFLQHSYYSRAAFASVDSPGGWREQSWTLQIRKEGIFPRFPSGLTHCLLFLPRW